MIEGMEVFDGVMLSDGGLGRVGLNARFHMSLSGEGHMDWLLCVEGALKELDVKFSPGYPKVTDSISSYGKPYKYCCLSSLSSPFLTTQYNKWYSGRIKVVPADLQLTPIVLANWFMGDGFTSRYGLKHWGVVLALCTHSFSSQEVVLLQEKLEIAGLHGFRMYNNKGWRLETHKGSLVDKFLDTVKPYILSSYGYKIKRPITIRR